MVTVKSGRQEKERGFFVCYPGKGEVSARRGRPAFAWHQHLPWGCPPFWSSARRLQWLWSHIWRWLPFWALLSAQQPEAGGRESSLLKQPSALGSALPLFWDWLLHSRTHDATWIRRRMIERSGQDRRQPRPANRPVVPAPTPPGLTGSTLFPPFQARAPVSFLFSASGSGNWQARRPMVAAAQAIPEHTSSSFPLGVRGMQEPAGVPFGLRLSSLTPHTLFSRHQMQSAERRPPPWGQSPAFLS